MIFRRIITLLAICSALTLAVAQSRFVQVLPPSGQAGNMLLFSDQLLTGGVVALPAGSFKALTSPLGDKAIILSSNNTAPVSFVSIVGGQLTGAVRTLNLDALGAAEGVISSDGRRLLVVAGSNPGRLFIIDLVSETIVAHGRVAVDSTPKDIVTSHNGRFAFVLSSGPGKLTVVDLDTGNIPVKHDILGLAANVSIAPSGAVYATAQYALTEFQGVSPFSKVGFSQVLGTPGKLVFSPEGRYALAPNLLLNNSSVLIFDRQTAGSNTVNETPTMGTVNALPIVVGGQLKAPDQFLMRSSTQALAYFRADGKLYNVSFPTGAPNETTLPGVGTLSGVTGVVLSDEFPAPKLMFYTTSSGNVFRADLAQASSPAQSVAAAGPLSFGGAASTLTPTLVSLYNNNQTVQANTAARPYAVRVTDVNGRPVYNALVRFTASTEGVTLSVSEGVTSLEGLATVIATAPGVNGAFLVEANVNGVIYQFTSNTVGGTNPGGGGGGGTPGGVARILKVSGDGQLTQAFNGFTRPFVVKLVDEKDQPLVGRSVSWSAQSGVSFTGGLTPITTTDSNGETSVGWIPNEPPQLGQGYIIYRVAATAEGIGAANFSAVGYPFSTGSFDPSPTAQLLEPKQENTNITVKLGAKLANAVKVIVLTSGGQGVSSGLPVPSVGLSVATQFTNPNDGPVAQCEGGTILTQDDGTASCTLIVTGKTGTTNLFVDVGGGYREFGRGSFPIILTVQPGDPGVPRIVLGNNQKGKPGETLPATLVAEITDGFGNQLVGLPVVWAAVTPGSVTLQNTISTTDQNGRVSTRVQLGANPGKFDIRLRVGDKEVLFKVEIESQVTGFAKAGGDGQTGVVTGQTFPSPLVVRVTDSLTRPVQGVSINWTIVSGSASLSSATSVTDNDGRAVVNVIAGAVAGNIVVRASIPNFTPIDFTLTSRLPGPVVTASGIRNYSTNQPGVAPGVLVRITGTGIATGLNGEFWANMLAGRLPFEMKNFKVEFVWDGGRAFAPILAIGNSGTSEWAIVQIPFEIRGTTASAILSVGGGSNTVAGIQVVSHAPGILEDSVDGVRRALVVRSDGLVVTPATPARKGEIVRMYVIGLGQTTPLAETNRVGTPDQKALLPVQVGLEGGKAARVVEAKMAENLVGIYEIFYEIPQDAPVGGSLAVACSVVVSPGNAIWSNESRISISNP